MKAFLSPVQPSVTTRLLVVLCTYCTAEVLSLQSCCLPVMVSLKTVILAVVTVTLLSPLTVHPTGHSDSLHSLHSGVPPPLKNPGPLCLKVCHEKMRGERSPADWRSSARLRAPLKKLDETQDCVGGSERAGLGWAGAPLNPGCH